jgi:hypothetical protein
MPDRATVLFGRSHERADRWLAGAAALGLLVTIVAANNAPTAWYLLLLGAAATTTQTVDNGGLVPGLALTVAPALALLAAFLPIGGVRELVGVAAVLLVTGVSLGSAATLAAFGLFAGTDRVPRPVTRGEVAGLLPCAVVGVVVLATFGYRFVPLP